MKKKTGKFAVGVLLILLAGVMTGCGKKEIDVMENLELRFNGVDGYGTASIVNGYDWEDAAYETSGDILKDLAALEDMMKLESAVSYEVYPNEGLSNGDEVTVKAVVDNEAVEKYKFKLKTGEKKFTVDGLSEVEQIDLFAGVDVNFQGISPYITAYINLENANRSISANYSINKDKNLAMGDTITMTVEYNEPYLLQNGYVVEADTKEYVVPNSDRYVSQITEIPEDIINKMNKQSEDTLRADAAKNWGEGETLKSINYAGCYLLTAKKDMNVSDKNIFYGIYKIDAANDEEGDFSYYSYCMFTDLIILKDGTCSVNLTDYEMPEGSYSNGNVKGEAFFKGRYYYKGYEELYSLFNNCVTKNIEQYEYESSIKGA